MAGDVNVIDAYLAELDERLPGSRCARRAIVVEVEDGLREAVDHHRRSGLSLREACLAAVAEFGGAAEVADSFAPELSAKRVHRYGLGYLAVGPLVGLLWVVAAVRGSFAAIPLPITVAGIAALVGTALVTAPFTVVATASTGRASRWIELGSGRAASALLVSAVGALVIDGSLLLMLLAVLAWAPHGVAALPVALGALLSVGRILFAAVSVARLEPDRAPAH